MKDLETLSVCQVLEKGADSVPDKVAVVDSERRMTYKDLNDLADTLAASLSMLGFRKGERLALYMPNSIELTAAFYALQKLGVIAVWVNPNYRLNEAEFIIRDSEARGVFIFREWDGYDYFESVLDMKEGLPALEAILLAGDGEGEGVYTYEKLLEEGKGKKYDSPSIDVHEDLSMFLYTSGTTGRPKGAMICHHSAVRAGRAYSSGVNASSEDIFIGALPMTHSYGCGAVLIQPLLLQSTVVLMDKYDTEKAFEIIEREKVTLFLGAPTHYILALNHKNRHSFDVSCLRAGLIAGYIAPEGLITRIEKEMGIYVSSFWGASEVGPGVGIMLPYLSSLDLRETSIGRPIPETEARVVDPVTHATLPDGEIGELTLSGWHVMKGYWRNERETRNQVVDGWLFTGDLVSRDDEGYFRIYGRTKDLINRGGFKIYPYELESVLVEHPKVNQVCVVAVKNPVLGENICVCAVPEEEEKVTLAEIRAFLKGKVALHKLPDELCIMEDFPRLSGGVKINKFGQGGVTATAENDSKKERYRG